MKITCVLPIVILLASCSSMPAYYQCNTPELPVNEKAVVTRQFLDEGLFERVCPVNIPKEIEYKIDSNITLTIRIKEEWLYLKAYDNGGVVKMYTEGLRLANIDGFTHALNIRALKNNKVSLLLGDRITYELKYSWINCRCIDPPKWY